MEATHLYVNALPGLALVRDDDDRRDIVSRMAAALGALPLAFCVMDTHLHVLAFGGVEHAARWLDRALIEYAGAFRRRRPGEALLQRGAAESFRPITGQAELAR